MRFKQETLDRILFEDPPYYALYNYFSRTLKLIDARTEEHDEAIIREGIEVEEARNTLERMDQDDYARELQRGQSKLFMMDGDNDG